MIRYKIIKQILLITCLSIAINFKIFSQSTQPPAANRESRLSCLVYGQKDSKILWNGTGFFIRVNSKIYFLTNNHMVGGEYRKAEFIRRNKELIKNKKKPLKTDTLPNNLRIRVYDYRINSSFFITLPILIKKDTNYIKFWQNKNKTNLMDVVAIPVPDATNILLYNTTIAAETEIKNDLLLAPSTDLFIIGFPYTYGTQTVYPIWKRATIASEPNLESIGQFAFLVDATTRAGMSGSPVIFKGNMYNSETSTNLVSGDGATFLVGIYSAQDYVSEIGVVWKLDKVLEDLKNIN